MHALHPFFYVKYFKKLNYETERFCVAAEPATSDDEKNMSDAELGRRLGVSRQSVNAIVNGRTDPTLSRLHEIAEVLDVKVRDLFKE